MGENQKNFNNEFKKFWKDGKNIAIVILSFFVCFFLFLCVCISSIKVSKALVNSSTLETSALNSEITTLDSEKKELDNKITEYTNKISELENTNKTLSEENEKLKAEKQQLETEKNDLTSKLNSLQQTSTTTTTSTTSSSSKSNASTNKSTKNNSYTVYVTKTGDKYHSSGCSYLRKSKIAIDKDSAVSQGYTPCSRCNP